MEHLPAFWAARIWWTGAHCALETLAAEIPSAEATACGLAGCCVPMPERSTTSFLSRGDSTLRQARRLCTVSEYCLLRKGGGDWARATGAQIVHAAAASTAIRRRMTS